jgi:hypothetical protein
MTGRIFVIGHKDFNLNALTGYSRLFVGPLATILAKKEDYLDSLGDNIAYKNSNYSELTGLYWLWKNLDFEIGTLGVIHYRRFLMSNYKMNQLLSIDEATRIVSSGKIIVPTSCTFRRYKTAENQYRRTHHIEDLNCTREVIKRLYPQDLPAFDIFLKKHQFYAFNIFVMSRSDFDAYSQWLFTILFEVEKMTDYANYSDYDKRIYGFLAERLFNVWLIAYKKETLEFPYLFESGIGKKTYFFRFLFQRLKRKPKYG